MSITLQQSDRELKIVWSLNSQVPEDLAGFLKITTFKEGVALERCSFYLVGEKEISTLVWRALTESLKTLLDRKIKIRFICNSKKIEAMLETFGFSLLGEVVFEASMH
ncbi:MAG: hypothetical protein ACOYK6_00065 [Chthoniobacterales bacterium]